MAMFPLGIVLELLVNGAWTDISQFCYQRDGITVTGGSVNWGDTPQPAQMTVTLNNRDGRFTPGYASGAYYPNLVRNMQVRLSVTATSSSGNFYSGYRFWGTVPEWPPLSDISGRDVYVQVTASGPLRQVSSAGGQGSALTRYYQALTGQFAPVAYWPCEEDPLNSGTIGAGVSGGQPMSVTTGKPSWKAISDFNGSAPIGVLNNSTWDGLTGTPSYSGNDVYSTPGTYTWVSPVSSASVRVWQPGGTGGGAGPFGSGGGGGGGGTAFNAAVAVTAGTGYTFTVTPGDGSGRATIFTGDAASVGSAASIGGNGGAAAVGGNGTAGTAGTAGTGGLAGGAGAAGSAGAYGGGGGSSAGTSSAGNNASGVTGGAAVTGGGKGASGPGAGMPGNTGGTPGGGGSGAFSRSGVSAGGNGGPGQVQLTYTPPGSAPVNVIRFILFVPSHGGNNNRVLLRAKTGGTVAQLDVLYATGGNIYLKGYNSGASLLFTSPNLHVGDGQTVMVSAQLTSNFPSAGTLFWDLEAIAPGAAAEIAAAQFGSLASSSTGNVTEVIVAPNADITKTAIGHISVQYAAIPLPRVSQALNGHHTELTVDRLLRLLNEQAMDQVPEWSEGADHWGFEPGVQGWTGTNASVSQSAVSLAGTPWSFTPTGTPTDGSYFTVTTAQSASIAPGHQLTDTLNNGRVFTVYSLGAPVGGNVNVTIRPMAANIITSSATVTQVLNRRASVDYPMLITSLWPTEGSHSLLITAAGGAGAWLGSSPGGTSGQPVQPGDTVSVAADVYAPAALGQVRLDINWYNSAGTGIGGVSAPAIAMAAGAVTTIKVTGQAPASAAFFGINVTDNETVAASTLLYADHVRVTPQMGPQTRKELAAFHREITQLDQGILKESKILNGLGFRTRIALINQAAAVTLDYSAGTLSPPLAPVVDTQHVVNHVVVKRTGGSKVGTVIPGGPMIPANIGDIKKQYAAAAAADAQLAALAQHLLNLGTAPDERYPTVTVNLSRASLPGNALAPLMSAVAGVEIGDRIVLSNLPFWFPSATASQLVIGYTETINAREWQVVWNCVPESPWEIVATSLRRWLYPPPTRSAVQ